LIGASNTQVGSNGQAGAAYIFTKSGSTWGQTQELAASDGSANDAFGFAVSLSSNSSVILIGSVNNNSQAGVAYTFTKNGSTWGQAQEISASDAASSATFGWAVALSSDGSTSLVTAHNKGVVYVFTSPMTTTTTVSSSANPAVCGQNVTFTAVVSPAAATGTVTFVIGGTNIVQTVTLSGGVATLSVPLGSSSYSVTATYNGDTNYGSSTSAVLIQQGASQCHTTQPISIPPTPTPAVSSANIY
jgi:hypothetical protein